MISSIKEHYNRTIRRDLAQILALKDPREVPKIQQVTLSYSFINKGKSGRNDNSSGQVLKALLLLEFISGQRGVLVKSRKDSAALKIRKGHLVAVKVNLTTENSYRFLEQFIVFVIPKIGFFKGFPNKSIDSRGNFSFRLENPILFPEIGHRYEKFKDLHNGLGINIRTNAKTREEALALITSHQLPFLI
jgi:large subunit ribosomal protein L5